MQNKRNTVQNKIKIVSNIKKKTINYYLKNANSEWKPVDDDNSPLAREEYSNAFIEDVADEIIKEIDKIYNSADGCLEIIFQGSDEEYEHLHKASEKFDPESNYITISKPTKEKIVFAGKVKSGKTILIEELCSYNNFEYIGNENKWFKFYNIKDANIEIYEVNGLSIGDSNITNNIMITTSIKELIKSGANTFIYCISTTRIELYERKLINKVMNKFPLIKIIIVLTNCINSDISNFKEDLGDDLKEIGVVSLLAREMITRNGIISAYGVDELNKYILNMGLAEEKIIK